MAGHHETDGNETSPLLGGRTAGQYDARDIDTRFKRWLDHVKGKKGKRVEISPLERDVQFIVTVFENVEGDGDELPKRAGSSKTIDREGQMDQATFERQLMDVRATIDDGVHPKMIQTGSSGSYFVRSCIYDRSGERVQRRDIEPEIVAVFKPHDEEPYGDLNPKRVLLRRYLWWAMGRPCLIASFSYLSEVGASLLDEKLRLGIVPTTKLVRLASKSFFYDEKVRRKGVYPEKQGSYQKFLHGYVNASAFLRAHPWPSRPRDLLERDLEAENAAHGRLKARKRKGKGGKPRTASKSVARSCISLVSPINCLAPLGLGSLSLKSNVTGLPPSPSNEEAQTPFEWTTELMQDFRLELERLVCFDFLIRNTDRGLDNFMVKVVEAGVGENNSRRRLTLRAIDNSLAFPWTHPAGIRSYPFGWLYLPTDLIGGPFAASTRAAFIPFLNDPQWWQSTQADLEKLFRHDEHFDVKKFEGQMEVLRGQGWNLLESLRNADEGPLELCARQKRLVPRKNMVVSVKDLSNQQGYLHPATPQARTIKMQMLTALNPKQQTTALNIATTTPHGRKEQRHSDQRLDANHSVGMSASVDASTINRIGTSPTRNGSPADTRDDTLGRAYRRGSLGIDVLHEIDRSNQRSKRPTLRKAFTRGVSATRIPGTSPLESPTSPVMPVSVVRQLDNGHEVQPPDDNLTSSVASLDSHAYHHSSRPLQSRRRIGSVSDSRSIASVMNLHEPNGHSSLEAQQKVRVLIESLEIDDGVAWQTWLGLS